MKAVGPAVSGAPSAVGSAAGASSSARAGAAGSSPAYPPLAGEPPRISASASASPAGPGGASASLPSAASASAAAAASGPAGAVAPPPMMAQVPSGTPGSGAAAGGAATVTCPQCAHINSPSNLFCSSCGYRLTPGAGAKLPATVAEKAPSTGSVLLTALRADGTEAGSYDLPAGGNATIGRDTGSIFASDSYLSPRHATFRQAGGKLFLKDEASLNGVYKKLSRDMPVEVRPNDVFRIGQEIVRYEPLEPPTPSPDGVERLGASPKGFAGRLALVTGRDTSGNAFLVPDVGMHMGRERGEVLFPEDGYVSGLHCRLAFEGPRLFLTDLGSSNGTFVRLREETEVVSGDILLMGQQLFRVTA